MNSLAKQYEMIKKIGIPYMMISCVEVDLNNLGKNGFNSIDEILHFYKNLKEEDVIRTYLQYYGEENLVVDFVNIEEGKNLIKDKLIQKFKNKLLEYQNKYGEDFGADELYGSIEYNSEIIAGHRLSEGMTGLDFLNVMGYKSEKELIESLTMGKTNLNKKYAMVTLDIYMIMREAERI